MQHCSRWKDYPAVLSWATTLMFHGGQKIINLIRGSGSGSHNYGSWRLEVLQNKKCLIHCIWHCATARIGIPVKFCIWQLQNHPVSGYHKRSLSDAPDLRFLTIHCQHCTHSRYFNLPFPSISSIQKYYAGVHLPGVQEELVEQFAKLCLKKGINHAIAQIDETDLKTQVWTSVLSFLTVSLYVGYPVQNNFSDIWACQRRPYYARICWQPSVLCPRKKPCK